MNDEPRDIGFRLDLRFLPTTNEEQRIHFSSWYVDDPDDKSSVFWMSLDACERGASGAWDQSAIYEFDLPKKQARDLRDFLSLVLERMP